MTNKTEDNIKGCVGCFIIIAIFFIIAVIIKWWFIIFPIIVIMIGIIYFGTTTKGGKGIDITKLYGEKKRDWKTRMVEFDNKCRQMKIQMITSEDMKYRGYVPTKITICPNCNIKLNVPNKCELCGWVKIYTDRPIDKPKEVYKEKRSRTIPIHVKREVWRRDQRQCVECGSRINLEYDHIIPFSKGGSNTVRNIQLLCEKCNRKKYNNI